MTILGALVNEAAVLSGATLAFAGTCAYVVRVAHSVNQWRKAEQHRNEAVDVVTADWAARGLTPEGAVQENARFRDTVENHVSAISDNKRRIDAAEIRITQVEDTAERTATAVEHLNDRFDDVDQLLHQAIDGRKDTP